MILVPGARGRVGRHVTAGLLEHGIAVRALSRRPDEEPATTRADTAPRTIVGQCNSTSGSATLRATSS